MNPAFAAAFRTRDRRSDWSPSILRAAESACSSRPVVGR